MRIKLLIIFFATVLVEGIFSLIVLLGMKFDPGRGHIFNYSTLKWALVGMVMLILPALLAAMVSLCSKAKWGQSLFTSLDTYLTGAKKQLSFVQCTLLVLTLFLIECFLMTYLAFPVPMRPLFLWAAATTFQVWLVLRIAYAGVYAEQPSLAARLRMKWNAWSPLQRKVFFVVVIIGLVYFLAFIPINLLRDSYGNFNIQGDEQVDYPDVVRALVLQNTFTANVRNVLESWGWQYGYPYLTISASVLLIPRLIFGNQFTEQVQLNIFLLRQFVSVLPMVLSLLLCVYLVTRFKSMLMSVSMFVFILLVPGIVKYNHQYWHPDSLILLLILLTIYFLQKDKLRFGVYFYLAAVACGLATAIKLWGLFFVLTVAGYLLAGLLQKKLTFKKFILAGVCYIFVMLGTFIMSSPSIMAPYIARVAFRDWLPRQNALLHGPNPDTSGFYDTGLTNWLKYFGFHYMKGYFFYFSFLALIAGSLWGSRRYLNRVLLGWCAATAIFLIYFVAMKNFQYMLPLAVPLYCGAFLFPASMDIDPNPKGVSFLTEPPARKIIRGLTIAIFLSQFIVNLVILYLYLIRGR